MFRSVEGVYHDGKIELSEQPNGIRHARVIVTFISDSSEVELQERGIGEMQAADLRWRLKSFEADWERPEMNAYDAIR